MYIKNNKVQMKDGKLKFVSLCLDMTKHGKITDVIEVSYVILLEQI